jgi:hypothetical protein
MEMQTKLGYKVDDYYGDERARRFYSDLRPVPNGVYERTKKEFEEHEIQSFRKEYKSFSEKLHQEIGAPYVR